MKGNGTNRIGKVLYVVLLLNQRILLESIKDYHQKQDMDLLKECYYHQQLI
ncbi:MAG: hypothetical protein K2M46_12080 [Lachnospiraceae bacterium]|nr:hypothetical protein [Lachnospiraceae bacterium]